MKEIVLWLQKIGTMFADRRFIQSIGGLLLLLFAIPETQSTEVIQAIGVLVLTLAQLLSWTYRPPSGLRYKEIELAEAINRTYNK